MPCPAPIRTSILLVSILIPASLAAEDRIDYPATRRADHTDTYHGTEVADPYRWLEDDVRQSEEVADWVAAQNRVTFGYLGAIPQRETIRQRR